MFENLLPLAVRKEGPRNAKETGGGHHVGILHRLRDSGTDTAHPNSVFDNNHMSTLAAHLDKVRGDR